MAERDRCIYKEVVHAVADSEYWQSRLWTWCDQHLDWGDRVNQRTITPEDGSEEYAWTTKDEVTCFVCLARM